MTATTILFGLVLEDGRRWGDVATRWQRHDARAILEPGEGDPRYHYLTRPRGSSKTSDLGGVVLAALIDQFPIGGRGYAFAADRDQAGLLLDSVRGFLERTDEISGAVTVQTLKVVAENGATVEIMASDAPSSWGLRPFFVVIDELAQWPETAGPRRLWTAVFSALPKVRGSRLAVLTSAGDPAHMAHKILVEAKASNRWRVSEVAGPTPWLDPADLEEQRRVLPDWDFRRLHLNEWTAADDRLTDPDDLAACVSLSDWPQPPKAGYTYLLTLDVGIKHDATVLAVTHVEDGTMVLDRMRVWTPTPGNPVDLEVVELAVVVASRSYGAELLYDPHQAVHLAQRLERQGIRTREFTFSPVQINRAALALHELVRTRRLAIPDDAALLDELANVRLVQTSPGVYRIDHDPSRHDDRAITLAMAAWSWGVDPVVPVIASEVPEEDRQGDPYSAGPPMREPIFHRRGRDDSALSERDG